MTDTREDTIRKRLSRFALERLNCDPAPIDLETWLSYPLPPPFRFGWMPPVSAVDDEGNDSCLVMFSPALMAAILAHVSDDDLDSYLHIVEFVLARHVARSGQAVETTDREIEAELYEANPEALMMRYEAEAKALGTIVPLAAR